MSSIRENQKAYRKNQILVMALDMFVAKGLHGTSTREISKALGISSGLMFNYFKSKEDLYETLIGIGCEKMVFDGNIANQNPYLYFREMLTTMFHELSNNASFAKMFVFINNVQNTEEITEYAKDLLASHNIMSQCIPIIEKGQEMGQFRTGNSRALMVAFGGAIQFIAQEKAQFPDTPLPEVDWIMDIITEKGGKG
ncbi:MAG: TetR/AcrR family transcriptional regulator [Sedimentibacter sp.]